MAVVEAFMRTHRRAAILFASLLLVSPAATPAQDRGGIRTETQDRMNQRFDSDLLWNILGLFGLLGLLGLKRSHAEDSYHPAGFE
jgi:hypothetical protein